MLSQYQIETIVHAVKLLKLREVRNVQGHPVYLKKMMVTVFLDKHVQRILWNQEQQRHY